MESLVQAVARHGRERPDALALADGRARLTWAEVNEWMERAAGWLAAQGLRRGDTAVGWLANGAEWYLLRLACERAGLFWIPVPASQGEREFSAILDRARPALLVTAGRFRDRDLAAQAAQACTVLDFEPRVLTIDADGLVRLDGPSLPASAALALDEPAHALTTSGSEGIPKLALYTLRAASLRAHAQIPLLKITPDDVFLVLSPGVGPARVAWLGAPLAGAAVVAMPVFSTDAALASIGAERATVVCGTPAQLAILAPKLDHADTRRVRMWYVSGSVLPTSLAAELETKTRGVTVSGYGGADFGGWAAPSPDDPADVRWHTVGRPGGGTELRIVDPAGADVPPGGVGEVIGRGPCAVSGYIGGHGRERWIDGWFHTGDLGRFDGSGNLVIVGRLKDVIIRGGDNIAPLEIETLLRTHPQVAQVAVIGVPDQILGERVCACIVAAEPPRIDLESLKRHLRGLGLAGYKLPERLVLLSSLPIVGDKIDRRALAAIAAGQVS